MADGDLALLAALLGEAQDAVVAVVSEVLEFEAGDSSDAGPGVGEGAQDSAVSQSYDMREVDRVQQAARLVNRDFGRLAVYGFALAPSHGLEGVEGDGMAVDQGIEKLAHGGERLVLGGGCLRATLR